MNEIKRFNKDAIGDTKMMEEVKEFGNDMNKIIAYANSKGYAFTMADLEAQIEMEGELSEDQLDEVSGGISLPKLGVLVN